MNLPLIYRQIAEAAGLEAVRGLAEARAGQRIYIPKTPECNSWLIEAMGETGAAALCSLYRGEAIDLPANPFDENSLQARARRIAQAIDAGLSANEIARAEGVTRRTVMEHAARRKARAGAQ